MDRSALEAPVVIEHTGDVLTFTLNRGDVGNEVSVAMFDAMSDALRSEAVQPKARVLRIRANGDVFCTGRERAGRDAVSIRTEVARLIELKRLVRNTSLISIAQVQGDALGFGFGLAILCDFTLVASSARLGFPEMRNGLPPAAIMAYLGGYALPKALFPMVLFGDPITPEAALQAGLVTRVCDRANLHADADALAARILSLDEAGAKQCKAFFLAAQEGSVEQNFRAATDMLTVNALRLMQTR
ncbi:enoyl-CoA hydratase/isomerase family protein [Paraburkholderia strydomiana]|uniref:enoyl-CoA hydratase/isomerase family protein n=1 Tax=Paraburkholderia strydomiana TaxID=1245417 RepID=UPI00285CF451|nr:enoyl-CoA hydratase/isomerase family protein [Paraburkholderia strydomiana]MDR7008327.1 enoyl-CoA hydratase/carnithine racemase [Paraburkholderia strydomiana]